MVLNIAVKPMRESEMVDEQKGRKQNPYCEECTNEIAEDDYSEESDANSVYMERQGY